MRQLTGQVEQLQYRNQQLEQQLRERTATTAAAGGAAARAATAIHAAAAAAAAAATAAAAAAAAAAEGSAAGLPAVSAARRGDAGGGACAARRVAGAAAMRFDPYQNPNAPGVPRTLGRPGTMAAAPPLDGVQSDEPPYVGAPGGRQAGAPLDLGIMAEEAVNAPPPRREVRTIPGALPAPPPRNTSGTGAQQMVMAPTSSPKDEYDLAYGYVLRKDYALAEEGLRAFVKKHPNDRLVADANYWLGESLFQRQRYREAAESFLDVSTKYETSGRAPELAVAARPVACGAEREAGGVRDVRRNSAQVSEGVREREAGGGARAEARGLHLARGVMTREGGGGR